MPAFVFPGQGSQHPGIGRAWLDHPSWEIVDDASKTLGRDLGRLLLDATPAELKETRNAQIATLTFSMVVLDAVERLGIEPTACAGHSVGEYTALVAAGSLGFEDSFRVVGERGEAMQAAADARPGVMCIVTGADPDTVDVCCHLADGEVWIANYNSPTETVIAGEEKAVLRACAHARDLGAASVERVSVGAAFHTPFMAPARHRLQKALRGATFHDTEIPVVTNVDAMAHQSGDEFELRLMAQVCSPVRWRRSVMRLARLESEGGRDDQLIIELGPGQSLTRMVAQTVPEAMTVNVAAPDDLDLLVDAVAGDTPLHAFASGHHGEHIYVSERVVVSAGAGVFEPAPQDLGTDTPIEVGTLLGTVSGEEVRSPFAGALMGMLAHPGERVQPGQPIAWLRAQ